MTCSACNDIGMYKLFWTVQVVEGVLAHYLFIIPCARCNLPAYSVWIVKNNPRLSELHPNLVKQEIIVGSA